MNRSDLRAWLSGIVLGLAAGCGSQQDLTPPQVKETTPKNGDTAVDPGLAQISVKFDEPMQPGGFAWAYSEKSKFPRTTGEAKFEAENTVNVLPVKLEPGKEYDIWINSSSLRNFRDAAGNPSVPYHLTFKTASK